jgi:hypothetical protein
MKEYTWTWRPLLIFAPDDNDSLKRQRQAVEGALPGIAQRDIAVVEVTRERVATLAGLRCI